MTFPRFVRYILIALILALLIGLGGFAYYIQNQRGNIERLGTERGFGGSVPFFEGSGGSTLKNIVSGLGFRQEAKGQTPKTPPRLWRVQATPTAGLGFIATATSTRLRFMERSTGYLFEADPRLGKVLRITNTLIPKVYEASFSGDGAVIGRMLNGEGNAVAFSATVGSASSSEQFVPLIETPLGEDILDIAPSYKTREFVALVRDGSGSSLIRSRWDGSGPKRIFSSRLKDWRIMLLNDDRVVLAQTAASGIAGNAYVVDATGELTPLARRTSGLSVLPRASSEALLISSDAGLVSIAVKARTATSSITLPIRTIADKCVWAPGKDSVAYCAVPEQISSTRFLDEWYRGLLHTNDTWWKITAASGTAELLFSPKREGMSLDVENPTIDDTGAYIAFRNAQDKSVWVLRVNE